MNWEISSTPITTAFLTTPVRIIAVAVDRPYRKLVHAVLMSMDAALVAPRRYWTPDAELGTVSSFEQLP
jgi:hypothetical protein